MRVLRPVVRLPSTMMGNTGHEIPLRCHVAGKLISHHGTGYIPMALEQLTKEALRSFRIPALLQQDVEHFSTFIIRAPQIHELAVDLSEHLVKLPRAAGLNSSCRLLGSNPEPPAPPTTGNGTSMPAGRLRKLRFFQRMKCPRNWINSTAWFALLQCTATRHRQIGRMTEVYVT